MKIPKLKGIKEKVKGLDMEKLPKTEGFRNDNLQITLTRFDGTKKQLKELVKKGFKPKMIPIGEGLENLPEFILILVSKKIHLHDYEVRKDILLEDVENPKEFFEELKGLEGGRK